MFEKVKKQKVTWVGGILTFFPLSVPTQTSANVLRYIWLSTTKAISILVATEDCSHGTVSFNKEFTSSTLRFSYLQKCHAAKNPKWKKRYCKPISNPALTNSILYLCAWLIIEKSKASVRRCVRSTQVNGPFAKTSKERATPYGRRGYYAPN